MSEDIETIVDILNLSKSVIDFCEGERLKRLRQKEHCPNHVDSPQKEIKFECEETFRVFHSMSSLSYRKLLHVLRRRLELQDSRMGNVQKASPEVRLQMTLRFLATGESFGTLTGVFHIPTADVRNIVAETLASIVKRLKRTFLQIPRSEEAWLQIASDFQELWNFPHCLGAVDGHHIAFRDGAEADESYSNYRNFSSIILLALVDAHHRFLHMDATSKGGATDAFNQSSLFDAMESNWLNIPPESCLLGLDEELPHVILADQGFTLQPWLMKPYEAPANLTRKMFNYRLNRAHRVAINALGIMNSKFRALQTEINLEVPQMEKLVTATGILHNFLIGEEGEDYLRGLEKEDTECMAIIPGDWRSNTFLMGLEPSPVQLDESENVSSSIRDGFATYLNSTGVVPWQFEITEFL
ncbi:hypothetical protein KR067_007274 [Drosophila pandora]|nr:hypothetical protein KR067_007274 [Drosophila pandora]